MKEASASNVVKSAVKPKTGVLKNRTLAAKAEARNIIAEADAYAAKLAERAERSAEAAYKRAKSMGEDEALAKYQEHVLAALELRDRAFVETEKDILRLSVKLAEKLVGRELETNPEMVVDVISTALQHARQKQNLLIRVNPADLNVAQKEMDRFKSFSRSNFIDIVADPRVGAGGCLIESEVGTVDARLETQFRVLKTALFARADGDTGSESK